MRGLDYIDVGKQVVQTWSDGLVPIENPRSFFRNGLNFRNMFKAMRQIQ